MDLETEIDYFLSEFINKASKTCIDLSSFNLDHIAYQTNSISDYEQKLDELKEISMLVHEAFVNNRRVAVLKLTKPIQFDKNTIIALEVIEPKNDQSSFSGWVHAEFVINCDYKDLIRKYPKLNWDTSSVDRPIYSHLKLKLDDNTQLKFHQINILETIKLEVSQ